MRQSRSGTCLSPIPCSGFHYGTISRSTQSSSGLPGAAESRRVTTAGGLYARIQFLRSLTALREPYEFRVMADSIGYIGFYRCDDPERFDGFLKETFTTVKKEGHCDIMIVDIRENGGGNSYLGDELMQYISPKPFRMFDRVLVKVSGEVLSRYPARIDSAREKSGNDHTSRGRSL